MIEWIIHLRAPVSRDAWADGRVGRKGVRRARPSGRQRETPSGDGLGHCWEIVSPQFASHRSWLRAASDDTGELTQRVCIRAACSVHWQGPGTARNSRGPQAYQSAHSAIPRWPISSVT